MRKKLDLFLCVSIIFSFVLFLGIFIRGQKDTSSLENRTLQKYDSFTIKKYLSSEYQNNLETFLSDQILFSGTIKKKYNELSSSLIDVIISDNINKKSDKCESNYKYIQVNNNVYKFFDNENFFDKYYDYNENINSINESIRLINDTFDKININKYLYYVSSSRSINLSNCNGEIYYDYLVNNLHFSNFSKLEVNDYNDYKKYFYKTDHHWNRIGQYEGYKNIQKLLGNKRIIKPTKEATYNVDFFGSYARNALDYSSKEKFEVYKYKLNKYATLVNGKSKLYGNPDSYDDGEFKKRKLENRYKSYYGADYGEVVYDFNNKNKENLLIVATSYSNSINDLIASNYNKTYVIDLRHIYKYDENFDFVKYVKNNNISEILFIGDITFFTNSENRVREVK